MTCWPRRAMGDIAPLVRRSVEVTPGETYIEIGIRSFARGVFHKAPTTGLEIGAKRVFSINPGDLLFNIVFAWEGAVAVATEAERGTIGSHRFLTCVVNTERADARYLYWWFSRGEGRDQLLSASPGGAGRNRTLGVDKLAAIMVPLPPLEEQRRIVGRIERIADSLREAQSLKQSALAEAAVLLAAYIGSIETRYQASTRKLHQGIVSYKNGLSRRPSGEEAGPIVLRLADVSGGEVNLESPRRGILTSQEMQTYAVTPDDLLIVRVNGSRHIVGRFISIPPSSEVICFNDHLIRVRLDRSLLAPRYVALMSRGRLARDFIEGVAITTAGQLTINQTMLGDMPIPFVPIAEQRKIVRDVEALEAMIANVRGLQSETSVELEGIVPSVLAKAFRGEL
jgi:type I restriction enzyme S subunit